MMLKKAKENARKVFYNKRVQAVLTASFAFMVSVVAAPCIFPVIRSEIEMPEEYINMLED